MSRPVNINETLTFNPTGYTGASNLTAGTGNYVPANGYHDHTYTTNYARWTTSTTAGYVYYTFTISGIPSNATITSVSCIAKIHVNNTSRVSNTNIQIYTGTTARGTSGTFATTSSTNTVTLNGGSSWTASEANNIRLRFGGTRASSDYSGYIYFYGATLSVVYSLQGTEYEITSTLATDAVDSIDPAGQTFVMGSDDYELNIYTDSLDDIMVEDNGVDVTNQLTLIHSTGETATVSFDISEYDDESSYYKTYNDSNQNAVNGVYNGNGPANGISGSTSSTRACIFSNTGAGVSSYLIYGFDVSSIPSSATITSVTCSIKAAYYSASYFDEHIAQLYSGTIAKGSSVNVTGTGSSGSTHTINGGSWTRDELDDIKIRFTVTRGTSNTTAAASFSFWGATLTVTYTLPANDYYVYKLNNVNDDHTIIIADSIIEIPVEDPQYDYYPITISSINATTEPGRGTTRVVEGTSQTITIYPDDPVVTLVTDNGVDISNQLVQHGGVIPDPTVATTSGASYGFTLNNSTGYYTSANKGVDKSAAVCRVTFNLPVRCLVTINYINYAEATYDFGVFGNIDTALNTNYYSAGSGGATISETSYKLACNTSSMNTSSVQTITYEIPSGQHYIDIKFSKDDATASNNDTLQWKISNIEPLETNNYYTYTISNIQEAHSLIFIFGDVTYYFINADGTGAKLFPSGSMVQLPGDYYTLTIVPDDYSYEVTVTDNNIDVTSQVQRKEEEITKEGNTYTVVNYIYKLNNIQATHNIVVSCSSSNKVFIKISGDYVAVAKIYKKISGSWQEVTEPENLFESNKIYIRRT